MQLKCNVLNHRKVMSEWRSSQPFELQIMFKSFRDPQFQSNYAYPKTNQHQSNSTRNSWAINDAKNTTRVTEQFEILILIKLFNFIQIPRLQKAKPTNKIQQEKVI